MEPVKKKAVTKPMIQAVVIMAVFYLIEIVMVELNLFPNYIVRISVDIALRIAAGIVSLILLTKYSKSGESKYTVKQLFTNGIPAGTWLVLIPMIFYIVSPFIMLVTAHTFTTRVIDALLITILQQFAVGFFEETTHRGLFMNGLIKHNTSTIRQRLFTVVIAGAWFGLSHAPNIFFGENPLIQVPSCFGWGMFVAAVYMLSDNLLLVMVLHALSDSTLRIVNGLFGYVREASVCQFVSNARTVIDYVILPVMAILICVFYSRLKGKESK